MRRRWWWWLAEGYSSYYCNRRGRGGRGERKKDVGSELCKGFLYYTIIYGDGSKSTFIGCSFCIYYLKEKTKGLYQLIYSHNFFANIHTFQITSCQTYRFMSE